MRLPAAVKARIVQAKLAHLARSKRPIVLGPFRSEVGFEQLYWVPFLTWALKKYKIGPERCLALSRGGMGLLYPAAQHRDLYAMRGVDGVRMENQRDYATRGLLKQTTVTAWDRTVADEAAKDVFGAGSHAALLHPSLMYWLLAEFWEERQTLQFASRFLDFAPVPEAPLPPGWTLPPSFLAVRIYERATLPLTPDVRALCTEWLSHLAARQPLVVLRQPYFVDDHLDFVPSGPNITVVPDTPPEQNLILQAAVLGRCTAFVGTYGGVAQWALRYRKPSLSLYTQFGGTALAHWQLSQVLAAQLKVPFQVMDVRLMALWQPTLLPEKPPVVQVPVLV